MKKASFGERWSSGVRRETFGRRDSVDGKDIRSSRKESHGVEKKPMLLKPEYSAKTSVLSDKLSVHDPKRRSSSVNKGKNPANPQRQSKIMNKPSFNLVASTQCITPRRNPNLPGINSSNKNHRLSYGVVKNRNEVRPLTEKEFQQAALNKIQNYFVTAPNASHILNNGSIKPMTTNIFTNACEYLLHKLDRNQVFIKSIFMGELPKIMKKYYYKGKVDRSWLVTVNASHSFPQVLGLLLWLVELCDIQNNFNVMDTLYPSILEADKAHDNDYEQTAKFKVYLPFLLNSYQVECKGTSRPTDIEFLQKQKELLIENYKRTLGIDEDALFKLETEVANQKEKLNSLCDDNTVEQQLEELKVMKKILYKDLVSATKYNENIKIRFEEMQEYISKTKDLCNFKEREIENLQKELTVVKSCIYGQQITQEDQIIIEEEIINLNLDIDSEKSCLNEYSNIVYSEDFNDVNVRLKLDKLFILHNKICTENIVALPELENAIVDKNVLDIHVRESLKEVDELLKCLKNISSEKMKAIEQKKASLQIDLKSIMLKYNDLKKINEKLNSERDADKKRLVEITDCQFKTKNEYENKLYELQAEVKNINYDKTQVEVITEEKNELYKLINEIEKEKEYILMKTTNSLNKHVQLLGRTKKFIENLLDLRKKKLEYIEKHYSVK